MLYLHLFKIAINLVPSACCSSSTSSSSLSSAGFTQQIISLSFLTFSRGIAGYLWLLAAALRNFCFMRVTLLSLASHVCFMFYTLYLTNQNIIAISTLLDFLNRVSCFNRLLPDGGKSWRSESCNDTKSSPEMGRFAFPLNGA